MSIFRTIALFVYLFGYMIVHYATLRRAERALAAGDLDTVERIVKANIPGGTYTGYDEDILTLAHNGFLCATADFPENDAYLLTKTTFSNLDWLREAYAGLDCYATQNPYEAALSTGVPLHDGSLRALQELGLAQ